MNKFIPGTRIAALLYSAFLLITVFTSFGYFAGISGRTKKGGLTTGCECHGNAPSGSVNVVISGPDTVSPGQSVNFLLRITGGPLTRGGTDIAVSRGILNTITGSGLRKLDEELTHEQPKAPVSGAVSFQFSYTAPPVEGADTIFANGNSVNFDMLPYNDIWNFSINKILVIQNPIGIQIISSEIPESFRLYQNFPNPFNPSTNIIYTVPGGEISDERHVKLEVYDAGGNRSAILVNSKQRAGVYQAEWNGDNLPSGVYFYRLSSGIFSETKRMVLVK